MKGDLLRGARYGPATFDMDDQRSTIMHGQCDPDACEDLKKMHKFTRYRSQKERVYFDMDGNA